MYFAENIKNLHSINLLTTLCFSFDQSFEVVKAVFNQFNLYRRLFSMINATTQLTIAAMTQEDFENSSFGKVCQIAIHSR